MGVFDNIITSEMKTLFTDGITAIIDGCDVPCTLIMEDTNRTDCPNCIFSPTTGRSSNKYQAGGPVPFTSGICPYCHGRGLILSHDEETINLVVLWDYKDWIGWKGSDEMSRSADGMVQTMSAMSTITKIKRAKEIILNTDIDQYTKHRFTRGGEPTPCGLGNDAYIFTMWKPMQ